MLLVLLLLFVRDRRAKLRSLIVDGVEWVAKGRFGVNRGALGVLGTVLLRFMMFNRGNFHVASDQESANSSHDHAAIRSIFQLKWVKTLLKKWGFHGLDLWLLYRRTMHQTVGDTNSVRTKLRTRRWVSHNSVCSLSSRTANFSLGILVSNKTLAEERGEEFGWSTKIRDLIPKWSLMDEEMDRGGQLAGYVVPSDGLCVASSMACSTIIYFP